MSNSNVMIVMDGANISTSDHGGIEMKKLVAAIDYFHRIQHATDQRQITCVAFIPKFWLHSKESGNDSTGILDGINKELLQALVDQEKVVLTPPQAHDDYYVIDYAMRHDGFIVTNDMFRDHIRNKRCFSGVELTRKWVLDHSIDFAFVGLEFLPNSHAMERVYNYTPSNTTSSSLKAPKATSLSTAAMHDVQTQSDIDTEAYLQDTMEFAPKRHVDLSEVTHYRISRHLLPYLHGENGETMQRFQKVTDTYIVLPPVRSSLQQNTSNTVILSIYGAEKNRQQAVHTLDQFVHEQHHNSVATNYQAQVYQPDQHIHQQNYSYQYGDAYENQYRDMDVEMS